MLFSLLASVASTCLAYSPPGLILSFMSAFVVDGKYVSAYRHEFVGTLLMIFFTFSAGKWVGVDTWQVAWLAHAVGVIAADRIGGGAHVNPAVSVSMWCLDKIEGGYTEMYVRIMGQMGGGLLAFPLYKYFADQMEWNNLGGPEFSALQDRDVHEAFLSEMYATILLCLFIYVLNWELNFGKNHYWIKQSLTAFAIRFLIEFFPRAGPAMNPMLGTAWAIYASGFDSTSDDDGNLIAQKWSTSGSFPTDIEHYFIYWVAPIIGAIISSYIYVMYAGGKFFGFSLPYGPYKKAKTD